MRECGDVVEMSGVAEELLEIRNVSDEFVTTDYYYCRSLSSKVKE